MGAFAEVPTVELATLESSDVLSPVAALETSVEADAELETDAVLVELVAFDAGPTTMKREEALPW